MFPFACINLLNFVVAILEWLLECGKISVESEIFFKLPVVIETDLNLTKRFVYIVVLS